MGCGMIFLSVVLGIAAGYFSYKKLRSKGSFVAIVGSVVAYLIVFTFINLGINGGSKKEVKQVDITEVPQQLHNLVPTKRTVIAETEHIKAGFSQYLKPAEWSYVENYLQIASIERNDKDFAEIVIEYEGIHATVVKLRLFNKNFKFDSPDQMELIKTFFNQFDPKAIVFLDKYKQYLVGKGMAESLEEQVYKTDKYRVTIFQEAKNNGVRLIRVERIQS